LRRFPHNPEAEKILLESIRSKDPQRQQDAVLVLNAWSYVIAESDLQVLLTSPLPSVRVFALRNAKSSRNVAYLPLVSKYASDPDSWVASEAKQAAEALRSIRQ
jgi:hypothetical protein